MRIELDPNQTQGRRILIHAKPNRKPDAVVSQSLGAWIVAAGGLLAAILLPLTARPRVEATAAAILAAIGLAAISVRSAAAAYDPRRSMPRFDAFVVILFPAAFVLALISLARP